MSTEPNENSNLLSLKEKLRHEGREFLLIFLYLALCLTVLRFYKQAILADYDIDYLHQGYALVEALILAKVIVLGQIWRLGEKYGEYPLLYSTLYKALVFTLLIIFFSLVERLLEGFLHHKKLVEIVHEILSAGWHEMLANALVMFFIFIPFFAFREIGRLTGDKRLFELFFHKRSAMTLHAEGSG